MGCVGQLSLEYLLLLLALFCVFAALLPLLSNAYSASLFALDSVNAKRFAFSLQEAVEEMSFQADGSTTLFEARPLTNWNLSPSGEKLLVAVQGPGSRQKVFEVLFPNNVGLANARISSKTAFTLRKHLGKVLLEYN